MQTLKKIKGSAVWLAFLFILKNEKIIFISVGIYKTTYLPIIKDSKNKED